MNPCIEARRANEKGPIRTNARMGPVKVSQWRPPSSRAAWWRACIAIWRAGRCASGWWSAWGRRIRAR